MNPRDPIYDTSAPRGTWPQIAGCVGAAAGLATLLITASVVVTPSDQTQTTIYFLGTMWAIGAPLWFFYEYFYIYRFAATPIAGNC